jgi:ribonuclease R
MRPPKQPKPSNKKPKLTASELQVAIKKLLSANPGKKYAPKQIIHLLDIANNSDSVKNALAIVEKNATPIFNKKPSRPDNKIVTQDRTTYGGRNATLAIGTLQLTRTGSAYVIIEGREQDVFVNARAIGTALDGDRVEVRVIDRPGARPEGEVRQVIERLRRFITGTIRIFPKYALLFPDLKMIPFEVMLELHDIPAHVEDGSKAVVEIEDWPEDRFQQPMGKIIHHLGLPGDHEYQATMTLVDHGFNPAFPPEVNAESESFPAEIPHEEIKTRRDFRDITTFTIDPEDAKDFDDALSIRRLENGNLEIGVHIADVSHYVRPGSALDREAYLRATSVYLIGRVCPMLPERLSNVLCSLRPNEDRLTYSAVFEMEESGKVVTRWFGRTVIHSDRRFSYEEAQQVIETGEGDFADEIQLLNRIALNLRTKRFANGSINFDENEVRFKLDETGEPVEAYVKARFEAHLLIEDFMLLANREVARYMDRLGKESQVIPFVYRTHGEPNVDKLNELGRAAFELGLRLDFQSPENVSKSLNQLVDAARENPGLAMLSPLAIRCMAKAVYSTGNIGHYGLGFEDYTHFTSPIRRYADVMVHRIIDRNLGGNIWRTDQEALDRQCSHVSSMEKKAAEAEREFTKYMQVIMTGRLIGQEVEGRVSGFIDKGFFVELPGSRAEGMVPFEKLNDIFQISDSRLRAVGVRKGRTITLGMKLMVRIVSADPTLRQIELKVLDVDSLPIDDNRPSVVKPKSETSGGRKQFMGAPGSKFGKPTRKK